MPVRLTCGLCGVMVVNGLLARTTWGHLELNPHGTAHACPMCIERHPDDWQERLTDAVQGTAAATTGPGAGSKDPYGRIWSLET